MLAFPVVLLLCYIGMGRIIAVEAAQCTSVFTKYITCATAVCQGRSCVVVTAIPSGSNGSRTFTTCFTPDCLPETSTVRTLSSTVTYSCVATTTPQSSASQGPTGSAPPSSSQSFSTAQSSGSQMSSGYPRPSGSQPLSTAPNSTSRASSGSSGPSTSQSVPTSSTSKSTSTSTPTPTPPPTTHSGTGKQAPYRQCGALCIVDQKSANHRIHVLHS
ncbi:hypothetical protein SISSUDRAFT_722253 [Sistotremastrum suecicum HHB10207 ss-3]|uniref:Extracellular membrane protein CFEM domain-containing protein n=1 Tax=Sistotremastrum suecicum HHB10207 ss-3 TaxID=1314776 RepID=A0A166DLK0_9AGAM|nr:hypothetical protein SISSUDRAFT_722253 [Sistotremastrum suecicum HHB10207 ss-3]